MLFVENFKNFLTLVKSSNRIPSHWYAHLLYIYYTLPYTSMKYELKICCIYIDLPVLFLLHHLFAGWVFFLYFAVSSRISAFISRRVFNIFCAIFYSNTLSLIRFSTFFLSILSICYFYFILSHFHDLISLVFISTLCAIFFVFFLLFFFINITSRIEYLWKNL